MSILENNHSQSALTMSTNNAVITRLKMLISPNDYKIGTQVILLMCSYIHKKTEVQIGPAELSGRDKAFDTLCEVLLGIFEL